MTEIISGDWDLCKITGEPGHVDPEESVGEWVLWWTSPVDLNESCGFERVLWIWTSLMDLNESRGFF